MKLYLLTEVAYRAEATMDESFQAFRYCMDNDGSICSRGERAHPECWLKLTTLDCEPEAVTQMLERMAAKIREQAKPPSIEEHRDSYETHFDSFLEREMD